jgi:taurine transport system substrate-binding protein
MSPQLPRHRGDRRSPHTRVTLAVVAGAILALTACGSSSSAGPAAGGGGSSAGASGAPERLRIAYQLVPNGDLVVKHEQWLEKALPNTKITWTKFDSGGDVNTAVVAGSVDIGLAGSSPVTRGLSKPLDIPYQVAWIHDVIGDAESLVVRNGSGIADLKGLAGKKIGTPFASTAHYSLLAALSKAGVAESAVKLVDLEPPDIQAAWDRGDIDGAYVWEPTLSVLKRSGTVLVTSTQVAAGGNPTYDLGVVTTAFAQKYPAALQTWLKAQDRAVKLIGSDPGTATKDIGAELNISPEEAAAQIKGLQFLDGATQASTKWLGTATAPGAFGDSLLAAATFLKSQQKIDAVPELSVLQAGIATKPLNEAFAP